MQPESILGMPLVLDKEEIIADRVERVSESVAGNEKVDLVELIHVPEWKSILIDLVKTERMDPWSIDIAELAEKYLQKIKSMEGLNLKIPANAMLCSAILLKFKAKKLKLSSLEEMEELTAEEMRKLQESKKLYSDFIPELKTPRMMRESKVSLEQLVGEIEKLLGKRKRKALFGDSLKAEQFQIPYSEENIEEKTEKVLNLIMQNSDSGGLCLFSHLTLGKNSAGIVDLFVPMLFLCNKGKVEAWQDEFWGEIFISTMQE